MRSKTLALIVALTLGFLSAPSPAAAQQFDWDRYQSSSLRKIVDEHHHSDEGRADYTISARSFPYSVKVTYGKRRRPIGPDKHALITHWVKATGRDPGIADLFEEEMLFVDAAAPYWLPVQRMLVPHFENELRQGDETTLYVMWIGKAGPDPVIIVNEFQK